MGIRCGDDVHITVACAMIGRYLGHGDDYLREKPQSRTWYANRRRNTASNRWVSL